MERSRSSELANPLTLLPPVEFACSYGSSLLPRNKDSESPMVDYILGVEDPLQWHTDNLEANRHHYSTLMARLGPRSITRVADVIGAAVHFNPYVQWEDKMIKYGVVRMQDLVMDMLSWNRFYLGGRLQKPVNYLIDNWDIQKVNFVNLKAAISAALLLLPAEFTEVQKIVQGSISSFRTMYRPSLHEYMTEGLLKSSSSTHGQTFKQDHGLLATRSLISSLPSTVQNRMLMKLGGKQGSLESGQFAPQITFSSRQEAANCVRKVLRRLVMVSSARQAVSGVLSAGGVNAVSYLAKKVSKAWKSRT